MSDHDYEATVETEDGTFNFSGDDPTTVAGAAAQMPVMLYQYQIDERVDLSVDIHRYMEEIAKQEKQSEEKIERAKRYNRRHDRD